MTSFKRFVSTIAIVVALVGGSAVLATSAASAAGGPLQPCNEARRALITAHHHYDEAVARGDKRAQADAEKEISTAQSRVDNACR